MLEIAFIRTRNIAFGHYVSRKQKKAGTVEQIYSTLKKLAENCAFETREEAINPDFSSQSCKMMTCNANFWDAVEPESALSIAVNREMGHQNRQRISSNNNSGVNAIWQFSRSRGANTRTQQRKRSIFNRKANVPCQTVCGTEQPLIVKFVQRWVANVTTVVFSINSQRYDRKHTT